MSTTIGETRIELICAETRDAVLAGSGGGSATAANQALEIAALNSIVTNTANIKIDADTINLNTDTLEAIGTTGNANTLAISGKLPATLGAKATAASMAVNIASDQTVPVSAASLPLPTGAATETTLAAISTKTPALGAAVTASSTPVNVASDQVVNVKTSTNTTPANANVAASASNVTLQASNANRRGLSVFNDGSTTLYVKLGATATLTSFTAPVAPQALYEVPFSYTGIVDGIWAGSPTGSARMTEITP